jgi:hypothetical protein
MHLWLLVPRCPQAAGDVEGVARLGAHLTEVHLWGRGAVEDVVRLVTGVVLVLQSDQAHQLVLPAGGQHMMS